MTSYRAYTYRWVILLSIIPIIVSTEMFWLTFAPVSSLVEQFYRVDAFSVSLLSVSYMIMYIVFSLPASWVVDKFGYRASLIAGALITAVFGVVRAVFCQSFAVVIIAQFVIAVGQPFLLNISTKVPANWFPEGERATAAGLLTMAQYLGFVVPMALSPVLASGEGGVPDMLMVYAVIACVSAAVAIIFTREFPPTPAGPSVPDEPPGVDSMLRLFRNRSFVYVLVVVFISMGIFNTLLTLIESILTPRGVTMGQAGMIGAVFVLAGVAGAVVLPVVSDRSRRRTPFFTGGIALMVPLYLGLTLLGSYPLLLIDAGLAGFLVMGLAPILFQHGAEVAYPAREGVSFGIILLMGQISGMLFVGLFGALGGNTMTVPMLLAVALTALEIPVTLRMRESDIFKRQQKMM